ncbi:MAG: AAA family ATPase, partial [Pyrinomonadaceae bacterium]|nr:AAA family ATPase [Pyrinomonadaceae bacterium]
MRLRDLRIKSFRNLKNFYIKFDDQPITVLLGKNGAAKSNLIEAITAIFASLEVGEEPPFAYRLEYFLGENENTRVIIDALTDTRQINIGARKAGSQDYETTETLDYETFIKAEEEYIGELEFKPEKLRRKYTTYLPSNVIVYYSGLSDRLNCYCKPVKEKYREELLNGEDPQFRRVFLTDGSHSPLILFAFLLDDSEWAKNFLADRLGVERLEYMRLTISRPEQWPEKIDRDAWLEDYGLFPAGDDHMFFRVEGELLQTLRKLTRCGIPLRDTYTLTWSELDKNQEKPGLKAQEELRRLHLFFHHEYSDPR